MAAQIELGAIVRHPRETAFPIGRRVRLAGVTLACIAGALGLAAAGPVSAIEPDLARLLRFMGGLKAVFALAAFGTAYWRLGRPAAGWRGAAYVAGPGLAAGGAVLLWTLQPAGPASFAFHAGLFWLVAAALSDSAFPLTRARTSRGRLRPPRHKRATPDPVAARGVRCT